MSSSEKVRKGIELADAWQDAVSSLERAKREVTSCECAVSNTENALGKWLVPNDAKAGEAFSIWHGDSLIQATRIDSQTFLLGVRKSDHRSQLMGEAP